jgi:hypothetical protein
MSNSRLRSHARNAMPNQTPTWKARALFSATALALMFAAAEVRADAQNGQVIPLGERQAYLANAGTGNSVDTGAVYFNPGSLGFLERDKVSVIGNVYMLYSTKSDAAFQLDDTDVSYSAKGFVTIPMTFVWAKRLGEVRVAFVRASSDQGSLGISLYGIQHGQSSLVNLVLDFPGMPDNFVTGSTRT